MGLPNRLHKLLSRPDALRWTVLFAVVLCLPSLAVGWILDDHLHHAMIHGWDSFPALIRGPWELFDFILPDPAWTAWTRETGLMPWYGGRDIQATFWRPLPSLLIYVDHAAPWRSPVMAHVHSLLWYAALVFLVGLFYRKLLGPGWVAALATLVFAVDEAHAMPVAWVANRNALLVMVFGVGALLAHIRWRRRNDVPCGLAAPVLLACSFASGEMAVCIAAYVVAFALFVDQGSPSGRLLSVVPTIMVVVLWRTMYLVFGFGVRGSGLYIDPASDPVRFAASAVEHVPMLLQAQLTPVPSQFLLAFDRPWSIVIVLVAAVVVAGMLAVAWHALRHDPRARFFGAGMLASAVPMAATLPHDRLLLPVGLGGAGLIALLLASVHVRAERAPRSARTLSAIWIASHLVIAPLLLPPNAFSARLLGAVFRSAPATARELTMGGRGLVFVTGPDFFMTSWVPIYLWSEGGPVPSHVRVLGSGTNATTVRRIDDRTLELESPEGFLNMVLDRVAYDPTEPFRVGQTVLLSDVSIRVKRVTRDGRPEAVECRFVEPLESLGYAWVYWTANGYRELILPRVGEVIEVPAVPIDEMIALGMRQW